MIVTCESCHTKYILDDDKVPEKGIRVKCPKCSFVWRLTPPEKEAPVFEVSSSSFSSEPPMAEPRTGGWAQVDERSAVGIAQAIEEEPVRDVEIGVEEPSPAQGVPPENPGLKKKRERAKRLARVFVSDILVYNKEKRDKALTDGNLMSVLGPEIKKAWEAYKEKVGPEVVESAEYFKNALNDILADGQKLF